MLPRRVGSYRARRRERQIFDVQRVGIPDNLRLGGCGVAESVTDAAVEGAGEDRLLQPVPQERLGGQGARVEPVDGPCGDERRTVPVRHSMSEHLIPVPIIDEDRCRTPDLRRTHRAIVTKA